MLSTDPLFRPRSLPRGFTVLELLVSCGMVSVLLALLLPALMHARERARRTICFSRMRQLGIATHHFHDLQRRLPRAWHVAADRPTFAYGWATHVLPLLEIPEPQLRLNTDRLGADLQTLAGANRYSHELLICPSDIVESSFALGWDDEPIESRLASQAVDSTLLPLLYLPSASFVGVFGTHEPDDDDWQTKSSGSAYFADGSMISDRDVRFADLKRGLSKTMIVGERKMATVPSTWLAIDLRGEDAECRLVGAAITSPNCDRCDECEFSSRHPGGSNFLWADGHITMVSDAIDTALYRENSKRHD